MSNMQIYFTQFTSLSRPVVKSYKQDFTKSIGASMHLSQYKTLQVPNLEAFDVYLNSMSAYDTITLGLTKDAVGTSKTTKAYNEAENPDFIFRGKNHIKYLNNLYPYSDGLYSLYFFDVDFDESQPEHFKMNSIDEVRDSLILLVPALKDISMLIRPSSSAGIYNTLTGEKRTDKPSWHIYIVVSNATLDSVNNFTEYIKRRANRDDIKLAYIKQSKSGATLERYYVDLAVADASRLIVEANPILEYPLAKEVLPSSVFKGGVLDLSTIDYTLEREYKTRIIKPKINTLHTTPTLNIFIPKLHDGQILISNEDKDRVLNIYKYLRATDKPSISNIRDYLNDTLISAYLTFLGFEIETNFKFKMRDEKTASASIAYNGYIKDFGGQFSGDIISFIMEVHSLSFIEAWKYLQNSFGKRLKLSIKTQITLPDAKLFEKSLTTKKEVK